MIGRVVSNKAAKTATILVESTKTHPLYKKSYISSKKYLVDDPFGVKLGDVVEAVKVAPISKKKHWRITRVVGSDLVALGEASMKEVAKEAISEVLPEEKEEVELSEQSQKSSKAPKTKKGGNRA